MTERELFEAALDQVPADRAAFLDQACGTRLDREPPIEFADRRTAVKVPTPRMRLNRCRENIMMRSIILLLAVAAANLSVAVASAQPVNHSFLACGVETRIIDGAGKVVWRVSAVNARRLGARQRQRVAGAVKESDLSRRRCRGSHSRW